MKNTIALLKEKGYERWFTEWYINAHSVECRIGVRGKDRKEKAKLICNELNDLFEALVENRVTIEPKK